MLACDIGDRASFVSCQEEEVSEELLTFHKAVYQMQEQEEELIDVHHQLAEVFADRLFVSSSTFSLLLLFSFSRFLVLVSVNKYFRFY